MTAITCRMIVAALAMTMGSVLPGHAQAAEVTVFAAASLKNALDAIAADWQTTTGNTAAISYDSSSKLAKQIQEGAPADIFISAASNWMDALQEAKLIKADTRRDLLGNTLVLVASGKGAASVDIAKGFDLKSLLGDGKLSMAMVDSVPAGQYGKEALESLGVWSTVAAQVAQAENVRGALALVATGEAPFGIVYGSDAIADDASGDKVTVVGTFPEDSHKPIVYPVAELAASTKPEAQSFMDALSTDAANKIFEGQGFTVLK